MFAMRWVTRLLSVISIATLARLLDKEDFGLVALASSVVALPSVLIDLGLEQAIISERAPERGLYNTAWTLRAIQLTIAAILIYSLSASVASFYGDDRIAPMLEVLSVMVALQGLQNIWTVSFRKELNFQRDFVYDTTSKAVAVAITISLAVWLRSYWALVYGQLAGAGIRVMMGLSLAPEWPRVTLSHWRSLWAFSQWSLSKGIATYIVANGDRIILGRLSTAATVGAYSLGREIADMPLTEIAMPANRALGPGFSALHRDDSLPHWSRPGCDRRTGNPGISRESMDGGCRSSAAVGGREHGDGSSRRHGKYARDYRPHSKLGSDCVDSSRIAGCDNHPWRSHCRCRWRSRCVRHCRGAHERRHRLLLSAAPPGLQPHGTRSHIASACNGVAGDGGDGDHRQRCPARSASAPPHKGWRWRLVYGLVMFVLWQRAGYPEGLERMVFDRLATSFSRSRLS
jgi:hypothetical protein